ncbi:tRNA (guanosine(37)-N1)-methyltransferase TrmD [Paenibacillus turpanensis]|uniref:tRNA (guanosine(37)-N1)-methyltransferase TrmD n=1 Tax=Paenibacillus turpanensis TaxID=2689078 RepID=UPI0014073D3E|nr:tRNA (guanosine(37)-N1)-methyltransferase TrmD [Paenibacillus turpanensis]
MKIDVLSLFPAMFEGVLSSSILGKARQKGLLDVDVTDFRDFSTNKHKTVDDYPYGGGGGMVLKPEPLFAAVEHVLGVERFIGGCQEGEADAGQILQVDASPANAAGMGRVGCSDHVKRKIILLCPQGEPYSQKKAEELAAQEHLILICGHYEGYDERIREHLITDEISLGDFVLTGGEIAAMAVIDSVARLLPGVLGNETSAVTDSFSTGLLEYPHYTRPPEFRGWSVPEVLLSGDHAKIAAWRRKESFKRTLSRRPELLEGHVLDAKEQKLLAEAKRELAEERKQSEANGNGERG